MNAGIWEIATARLCASCIEDMAEEYIFRPFGGERKAEDVSDAARCA